MLGVSAVVVLVAFVVFAVARARLADALVAMAILGFGVGSFSAAMPTVILAVTPPSETSSAMGVNQVVRSVGFAIGSAAAGTRTGQTFPANAAYTAAARAGVVIMVVTAIVAIVVRRRAS
jgi:predicted MFS family arabinose efflux permease